MDRKEFSELLVKAREDSGVSRYALCKALGMSNINLRRVELAENNYKIHTMFSYLHILNKKILLSSQTRSEYFNDENSFVTFIIKERGRLSINKLANIAGITKLTLFKTEHQQTTASIDTFLKLIEALGFKIDKIC